ncbi:MAG: metallophosphatase [Candidatus Competibacteraceae bacterium]|nr:MAG: metallophosphatase [Candidatus Competibacteraceae bacterium]
MAELTRRDFLKLSVVAATASLPLGLAGCNNDNDDGEIIRTGLEFFPQSLASGDPRPDSVVLWTRVEDAAAGDQDLTLRLQVATDLDFQRLVVDRTDFIAASAHDHCLKVKVTALDADAIYHYRFLYFSNGIWRASNAGRTRTAPAPDSERPIRFASLNCQDYIGRYYNTLAHLLQHNEEPDFIVHVGDYVYETTGDPSFQTLDRNRDIQFTDPDSAIALGDDAIPFFAAKSVGNYRDLYQTYRRDPMLQQLHERFPMIAVWDDHEYSDDCHGAVATYFNGRRGENDPERRRNAEQVFFEFMPVDDRAVTFTDAITTERSQLYPNTRLYREFLFGRNLHLLVTDYRSFRPDHLIPEDAFPGQIVLDKATLIALFDAQAPGAGAAIYEAQKAALGPYVDLNLAPWAAYRPALVGVLTQAYLAEGLDGAAASAKAASDLSDQVSAFVFNQLVAQFNAAVAAGQIPGASALPLIDDETYENVLERGIAYLHLGKQGLFTEFGSRYGAVKPTFELYNAFIYARQQALGRRPEDVFGAEQEGWLYQAIDSSPGRFLAMASSVSTTSLIWDLSGEASLPAEFRTQFLVNVDQWDGFPTKRQELLARLRARGNAFVFAGDIHASFVTDHDGVADFTGPAVSSTTFSTFVSTALPALTSALTPEQQQLVNQLLVVELDRTFQAGFPKLKFADSQRNGYLLLHVEPEQVTATYHLVDPGDLAAPLYDDPDALNRRFSTHQFVLRNGLVAEV